MSSFPRLRRTAISSPSSWRGAGTVEIGGPGSSRSDGPCVGSGEIGGPGSSGSDGPCVGSGKIGGPATICCRSNWSGADAGEIGGPGSSRSDRPRVGSGEIGGPHSNCIASRSAILLSGKRSSATRSAEPIKLSGGAIQVLPSAVAATCEASAATASPFDNSIPGSKPLMMTALSAPLHRQTEGCRFPRHNAWAPQSSLMNSRRGLPSDSPSRGTGGSSQCSDYGPCSGR
jgi:hypothetical protein